MIKSILKNTFLRDESTTTTLLNHDIFINVEKITIKKSFFTKVYDLILFFLTILLILCIDRIDVIEWRYLRIILFIMDTIVRLTDININLLLIQNVSGTSKVANDIINKLKNTNNQGFNLIDNKLSNLNITIWLIWPRIYCAILKNTFFIVYKAFVKLPLILWNHGLKYYFNFLYEQLNTHNVVCIIDTEKYVTDGFITDWPVYKVIQIDNLSNNK